MVPFPLFEVCASARSELASRRLQHHTMTYCDGFADAVRSRHVKNTDVALSINGCTRSLKQQRRLT